MWHGQRTQILLFLLLVAFKNRFETKKMTQKQKTMKQQVAHKIMTFNIRFDNPQDGINRWEYRSEGVCERLISYKLDILCLQEALEDQYGDIYNALKISGKYQLISKGREYDPVRDVCFGEACSGSEGSRGARACKEGHQC